MEGIPFYVSLIFMLTTFLTVFIFYRAASRSKITLLVLLVLLALQMITGLSGFYTVTNTIPPRFMLLPVPPLLFILILFLTAKGRQYIDGLDKKFMTLLHIIRVPIEITLFLLFIHKTVPQLMTFEGRNFDILAGLTAPFIYYFGFVKNKIPGKLLLAWNFICLGLLLNIVINAILSAPFPFQQFGFEQPDVALLYFPYVWLPGCVVPLVLLSHLVTIRYLLKEKREAVLIKNYIV
jgi:hypothetical protein